MEDVFSHVTKQPTCLTFSEVLNMRIRFTLWNISLLEVHCHLFLAITKYLYVYNVETHPISFLGSLSKNDSFEKQKIDHCLNGIFIQINTEFVFRFKQTLDFRSSIALWLISLPKIWRSLFTFISLISKVKSVWVQPWWSHYLMNLYKVKWNFYRKRLLLISWYIFKTKSKHQIPSLGTCHNDDFCHWCWVGYDCTTSKTKKMIYTFSKLISTFAKTG